MQITRTNIQPRVTEKPLPSRYTDPRETGDELTLLDNFVRSDLAKDIGHGIGGFLPVVGALTNGGEGLTRGIMGIDGSNTKYAGAISNLLGTGSLIYGLATGSNIATAASAAFLVGSGVTNLL